MTRAKFLCAGDPGGAACDLLAGPSEVLVIADAGADAELVAADLLSQAEHGPDSQVLLLSDHGPLLEAVRVALVEQLASLPREKIAAEALSHARIIRVADLDTAVAVSNRYAPEHLILQVREPHAVAAVITAAGSVFLGPWTPESAGDYASGTNHVLPTHGWARNTSGLGVEAFTTEITFQELTPEGLADIGPVVETLASIEGLDAHRLAVRRRRDQLTRGGR